MTPQIPLPQFYRQPVLLNSEIHGRLRIAASPSAYAFAAGAQTVLLAGVEFFDAGRQFPILFARNGAGGVFPFALLGLEAGENLFVGTGGEWRGRYLPAYLRRYPFIHNESEKGMAVFIDEAFEGFGGEEGEALFDAGKPTPKMEEILVFLREYYQQMKQTEVFCARLASLGLLRPIGAQVDFHDGRSYTLNGMLAVDEQTLRQLPDAEVLGLFRDGALALVTAHLLSLKNLSVLMEFKSA